MCRNDLKIKKRINIGKILSSLQAKTKSYNRYFDEMLLFSNLKNFSSEYLIWNMLYVSVD